MTDIHDIAARLKNLRRQSGLSMEALAKSIGMKGASSYQRYESSKNYHRKEFLPFDIAVKIGRSIEGKGISPVQFSDVIALSGVDRAGENVTSVIESNAGNRSAVQIYKHHMSAVESEDIYAVMTDFDDWSAVVTKDRVYRGTQQIEGYYAEWTKSYSGAKWNTELSYGDDVLLVEWTLTKVDGETRRGSETYIFKSGRIAIQTVSDFS